MVQVYLRIKEAMELAEEARLERDAARTETDSWQVQLAATQVTGWGGPMRVGSGNALLM